MTLRDWVFEWLQTYKRVMLKPSTYDAYVTYASNVTCDVELNSVTTADVQGLINGMVLRGCAYSTVKHMLTIVRQSCRKARQLGLIDNLAMLDNLELPRRAPAVVSPLGSAQVQALIARSSMSFYGDFFVTLMMTGARVGELIALRWCDVDLFNRVLHIRNTDYHGQLQAVKTRNGARDIPIFPDLFTVISRQRRPSARAADRVFVNTLGRPIVYRSLLDAWHRFTRVAGISVSPIGLHVLRHTFAHTVLRAGVPVKVVSRWLGHGDIYITLSIYDAVDADDMARAADIVAGVFSAHDTPHLQKKQMTAVGGQSSMWL